MNILLTGCAGFIGSHLAEALLKSGHSVLGIDNFDPFYDRSIKESNLQQCRNQSEFIFKEADITEISHLQEIKENADMVIHLAAKAGVLPSLKYPGSYIHTNITGTKNILEFIKSRGIKKYIFASSSSIYGNNKNIPFTESDSVDNPISPYAFTKKSCELMNYTYHHLYDIDTLNLRFFTVYGPRQRPDLAIHKFLNLIENEQPITMYGDGSTARDYTYIDDIIGGILKSVDYLISNKKIYEIINLGNGKPVKLFELISMICDIINREVKIKRLPRQPGDVDITYASIAKAKTLLGYNLQTSFETGILNFVNWHSKNLTGK